MTADAVGDDRIRPKSWSAMPHRVEREAGPQNGVPRAAVGQRASTRVDARPATSWRRYRRV
jgi:hypothetical protein